MKISTAVSPEGSLEVLSQLEVKTLLDTSTRGLYRLFRNCALAVLNTCSHTDDPRQIGEAYGDFEIGLLQRNRGVKVQLENAPASAFVDGQMIRGIREHLFAVLRDIIYTHNEIQGDSTLDLSLSEHMTAAVFRILRNARVLRPSIDPNIVVCWGGHSISREEYDFSKEVGYQLGLRGLDVCTGCGPGAMKGPMKGAAIGHAKQRIANGRYIGLTEPGVIASEPPNPIVNELVILPDIEKRLEAFVRIGHGVLIFPGGVGTAEELLYLLGILSHPDNAGHPFPLILCGPAASADYFTALDDYVGRTLGSAAQRLYRVIIDDPVAVARSMRAAMETVKLFRQDGRDAFYFNWQLHIARDFQAPFVPTHAAMAALSLQRERPVHQLAADLRRAFSGIAAGNVKEQGIRAVEEHGPFEIRAEADLLAATDELLQRFVAQRRMKLQGDYTPCYTLRA
ncbi:MAG TPA: nucleotide 5'-monophosphate nucleosidase PpnN [Accumulibacter sp.]|nr:nucleotide 5'-monophosphate nucleosidase PpnN [Accumulibacter sp.]